MYLHKCYLLLTYFQIYLSFIIFEAKQLPIPLEAHLLDQVKTYAFFQILNAYFIAAESSINLLPPVFLVREEFRELYILK